MPALRLLLAAAPALAGALIAPPQDQEDAAPPQDPMRPRSADEIAALEAFENHVRPVLVQHCIECHSGDKPKGGLRLDSTDALAAGVGGDPLFAPGEPDLSLLVEAIRYDDPFVAMPPDGKLSDAEIAGIERWIELGAALPEAFEVDPNAGLRWCFQAPEHTAGADIDITALVDRRLAEAQDAAGVAPTAPAARRAWLRRVTYDLTGLPPTPDEIAAFDADTEAGSEGRVVDRLLGTTAFAERWARHWLDLVRYAETRAHEYDFPILNAYRYRDYVIRAFDADVPYDRFVTELLAGDLVGAEEPRPDAKGRFDESPLGTGAWFLGEEVHSPVEPRGDQTDRIANQVEVLSKSLLGLGVACARCHDHKFDPISAEDYHALAGFALSTVQRQFRYESNAANARVAAGLRELEEAHAPAVRAALAAALRAEADGFGDTLLAAHTVLRRAAIPAADFDSDTITALDTTCTAQGLGPVDLLLEDFEDGTFESGGLGPWERTGEAFAERPLTLEDRRKNQPEMEFRGTFGVNTYSGHGGGDHPTGTLTSAPFTGARRYLHLLVNGGNQDATRVELVDAESGEVLADVHGPRRNTFLPRRFDLAEYDARLFRLRLVDDDSGAWGQIGVDHVVLSDEAEATALDSARPIAGWAGVFEDGAVEPRIMRWVEALERLGAGDGVGAALLDLLTSGHGPSDSTPAPVRDLVRWGDLTGESWITNGPGFGPGPRGEADVTLTLENGVTTLTRLHDLPSAVSHPLFAGLEVVDSQTDRRTELKWIQAGRTVVSPTFECESGSLWHLVRGRGGILVSIASHKLLSSPLHTECALRFDTGGAWQWVRHDLPQAKGLVCHVEVTGLGDGTAEIARTVECADERGPAAPTNLAWVQDRADEEAFSLETKADRARWIESAVRDAADLLDGHAAAERVLYDEERAFLLGVAGLLLEESPRVRTAVAAATSGVTPALAELASRRVLQSRLAPAALDLEGRDERVLDRGSWKTPLGPAPRRAPRALRASDEPLARDGADSGRLALARDLVASESALLQRVWVNRNWQWLFGTGIVATPDDFGAMGAEPTHAELLDELSTWFGASGWSTKGLVRALVLTDAYRRGTAPTDSARASDPANRLLSHMPVRRLEAEEIRDGLLAVSGELDATPFGEPVRLHLTEFMKGRGRPKVSGPLDGDGRRSIYLSVRRNFPHPFLTAFDLPSPTTCRGKRSSANVPAQALAMLNDPFVEERAQAFARSLASGTVDARAREIWLRALGREPSEAEYALVRGLAPRGRGGDDGATWTDVCHTVFNLKEFVFLGD